MLRTVVRFSAGAVGATTTVDPNGDLKGPRTIATVSITTQCPSGQSATLTVYIFQSVSRLINIGIGTVAALYLWIPKTPRKSLTAQNHI